MRLGQRLNQLSFFSALCLFLSAVEYAVPKPLPFMRLGFANLPILLAVKKMPAGWVMVLVLLKILLQAFISGTLLSYV
ncbi:MAG: Gx transporter family protein, partial [Treponema sp.]|nr:Gx transporter family protein [Treponema sp.]